MTKLERQIHAERHYNTAKRQEDEAKMLENLIADEGIIDAHHEFKYRINELTSEAKLNRRIGDIYIASMRSYNEEMQGRKHE